jgi:hypothetical protein
MPLCSQQQLQRDDLPSPPVVWWIAREQTNPGEGVLAALRQSLRITPVLETWIDSDLCGTIWTLTGIVSTCWRC